MASRVIHDKIPHNVRVNKGVTVAAPKRPRQSMDSILRQTYEDIALADRCAAVQDSDLRGSALKTIRQLVVRKALNSKAVAAIHDDSLRDAVNAIIKPFGIQQGYANENALNRLFAGRRSIGQDAVSPSTKGINGVKPSTIGLAAQKRFAELAKVAMVTSKALDTCYQLELFDVPPELEKEAELVISMCVSTIKKLAAITNELLANSNVEASSTADQGADYPETSGATNESATSSSLTSHRMTQEERVHRSQAHVAAGMDAARPILTAEDAERVERARAKVSRLKTAEGMGDAGDIVRARSGMDERALDADDLYRLFEGERK